MVGVACDTGNSPVGSQWHIPGNPHRGFHFKWMRETFVGALGVTGKFWVAFAARVTDIIRIGQLLAIKGERLVAVKALSVTLVVMNG